MTIGPGSTLSHYRLIEKIGEGGMGVVYRAHDTRLQRDVALKVLPAGVLSDDAARKRFRKEALALSKLNHPNIATVFDFDSQAGTDFLVMEYIPGTTLDKKVSTGPLPEKEIAQLGRQIAEGLAAAHDQSVLHRDLKPANIRITTDGRAKVLDFGLAKLIPAADMESRAETATASAALAGTLPYMAPEQLRRERLDSRTDIFAIGDVLYEMATGRRPFQGDTLPQLSEAILHEPPVTPRALNSRLSPDLERIIIKCLEKEPERRYQSAKEVEVDLRRLGASGGALVLEPIPHRPRRWLYVAIGVVVIGLAAILATRLLDTPGPPITEPEGRKVMLVVLPFENLSADPEQEYFSDGMTEEMISHLGRLQPETLGVIARTSAMHYKRTDKQADEIGRELGVQYLLEGSVRRAAGRVRITAQLIQVSDQTHLWSESYERGLADIFAVQNNVADRIARSLALELLPEQQARLDHAPRVDPEAHDRYLRGRFHLNKRTGESLWKGLDFFERAIEEDPAYAPAHAGLADSYTLIGWFDLALPGDVLPKAKAASRRALEIDESLAEAHTSLAAVLMNYDWDWAGAEREFRRAIELNPDYPTAHQWYAILLSNTGRFEEAIVEIERAQKLDPLSLIISANVGLVNYNARQFDEALGHYLKTLDMEAQFPPAIHFLQRVHAANGMYEEALAQALAHARLEGERTFSMAQLAHSYALVGRNDEARAILKDLLEIAEREYVPAASIALIYDALGEDALAFEWLEKACDERSYWVTQLRAPLWDRLRARPPFQALMRRVGLPAN